MDGIKLPLSRIEFKILRELMMNIGQALTIYQLGDRAWGYDYLDADTAARVHTKCLKEKLGENGYLILISN